ncbi:5-hydroxytryptamine receptor 1D-like [Paramacrobiotus metropolitanus]|uniref:5-hydroxytryptamine receptor 1D-like n=1 Tax=Paramacrobiotus metropolitanus TaxID=2943436 RepID=UPI002445AE57|nr:5-hydroxytryptamine receptor 1D-like [Paramacrobiotus metropolitanus]
MFNNTSSLLGLNISNPEELSANFSAISTTVVFILSITAIILVLYLFYRVDNLSKKPFNVFMLNLIITDFVYCIWENAFDIGIDFLPSYWKTRNSVICSVYLYSNYTLQAATCNAHMLITLNRLWAILFPHSYKSSQKISVFAAVCLGKWIYLHIVMMPGFIADILYYRQNVSSNGCFFDIAAQPTWNLIMIVLLFVTPLVVMVVSYPFIYYKYRVRRHELQRLRPLPLSQLTIPSKITNNDSQLPQHSLERKPTGTQHSQGASKSAIKLEIAKSNSQTMLILTMLTTSATICWTPNIVVFMVYTFIPFPEDLTVFSVVAFIFSVQLLMDPVLFVISLSDLREAFRELIAGVTDRFRQLFQC